MNDAGQLVDGLVQRVGRDIGQLHVRLVGDDVHLDGREEAQSSVGEGDGHEEVWALVLAAGDNRGVGQDHFEGLADVLEEAVLVGRGFDAPAADQPSYRQINHFGDHRYCPASE